MVFHDSLDHLVNFWQHVERVLLIKATEREEESFCELSCAVDTFQIFANSLHELDQMDWWALVLLLSWLDSTNTVD